MQGDIMLNLDTMAVAHATGGATDAAIAVGLSSDESDVFAMASQAASGKTGFYFG